MTRHKKIPLQYQQQVQLGPYQGARKRTFCAGSRKTNFLLIIYKITYKSLLINVLLLSGASEVLFSRKTIAYNHIIQLGCEKSLAQKFKFLETMQTIRQLRLNRLSSSSHIVTEMPEIVIRYSFIGFRTSWKFEFLCHNGLFTPKLNFNINCDWFSANIVAKGPQKA